MSALELHVDGASRVVEQLEHAAVQLEDDADAALADFGSTWLGVAVRTAPRQSGRLAASHALRTTPGAVQVTATVRYAVPVYARNPWLRRARENARPEGERALNAALERAANI